MSGVGDGRSDEMGDEMSEDDEHFPWHYTEFGVVCVCGASMNRFEECPNGESVPR